MTTMQTTARLIRAREARDTATKAVDKAEERVVAAVSAARAAGSSWAQIATALGVTKQAAYKRYGRIEDRLEDFPELAKKAADRGLDRGLIAALRTAGGVGALRLEQLVDGSDSAIARANKAFAAGKERRR